jgi:uncharacterized membrane protein YgcG
MEERISVMLRAFPLLLLAGLAGCNNSNYNNQSDMSYDFGNSVQANIAMQVVHPLPTRLRPATNTDATRMNNAFVRYETNRVYQPRPVQTLQSGMTGAGGGGGGGGASSGSEGSSPGSAMPGSSIGAGAGAGSN